LSKPWNSGIFVTGTDTHCGKTIIAGGVARAYLRKGYNIGVMKPVATWGDPCREPGVRTKWISEDALHLRHAAAVSDSLDLINPVCFKSALAPWPAARFEKKTIDVDRIMSAFRELSRRHDHMVVEGAGGLMVPINQTFFVSDLIGRMKLPAIIVSSPGLGMLNHSLLTVNTLKQKGIPLAGIIINRWQGKTRAEQTNPQVLQRILKRRIIVVPDRPHLARDLDSLANFLTKKGLFHWPYLP